MAGERGPIGAGSRTLLLQTALDAMYGVAWGGGPHDGGTAFRFNPQEVPVIERVELGRDTLRVPRSLTGSVILSSPAEPGGVRVQLASVASRAAAVPQSVTVPAGQRSASFRLTTRALIDGPVHARMSASVDGTGTSMTLILQPEQATTGHLLREVRVPRATLQGGQFYPGEIVLTRAARAGGVAVPLKSSASGVLRVPETVFVGEGLKQAVLAISTLEVERRATVQITAGSRRTRRATVRVAP